MAQINKAKKIDLYTATPEYQNFIATRRSLPLFGIGRVENSCVYYFEYSGPKSKEDTALVMLVERQGTESQYFDYDPEQPTSVDKQGQPYAPTVNFLNKFTGARKTRISKSWQKGRKYLKKPRKSTKVGNQYFAAIRLDSLAPFLVSELISRYGKRRYITMNDALKIKFFTGQGYRIFNKNFVSNFTSIDPDEYINVL
tara:strand:- start:31 stop:624 length:594 start_codon:yes stop_codon:yes gene_type:complete